MKRIIILAVAVVAAITASCTKEQNFSARKSNAEVTSIFSHAAKTVLGESGAVNWVANDSISVLYASENAKFVTAESGASVEFTGEANPGANQMYALYPYSKNAALDGSKITLEVPAVQTAVAGTFNPAAGISVGAVQKETESYSVEMMNVGALIQITISGSNISKVKFKGNDGETLAGVVEVDAAGTPSVSSVTTAQKEVSLIPGGQYFEPGTYYIAVLPATLTKGFTLTYYKVEESQEYAGEAVYSSEYPIVRAHLQPLGSKEGSVVWIPTTIVREYVFHNGIGACWPFDDTVAPRATTTPVYIDKIATFISNDANHDVLYYYSKSDGYYIDNSSKMFLMDRRNVSGPQDHAYFQTPAIKGLTLTKAVLTLGGAYSGKEFSIEDKSGQIGNVLKLGDGESEVVFNIPEDRQVEENWYRIRLRTATRVTVKKLTLYFAGEEQPTVTYIAKPSFTDMGSYTVSAKVFANSLVTSVSAGLEYKTAAAKSYTSKEGEFAGSAVTVTPDAGSFNTGDYTMHAWASANGSAAKIVGEERVFKTISNDAIGGGDFTVPDNDDAGLTSIYDTRSKARYWRIQYAKTYEFHFWADREITYQSPAVKITGNANLNGATILFPEIEGYIVAGLGMYAKTGGLKPYLVTDPCFLETTSETSPASTPEAGYPNRKAVSSKKTNVTPQPSAAVSENAWFSLIPEGEYSKLWLMSWDSRQIYFSGMHLVYYAK